MARKRSIKLKNGGWALINIQPDWKKLNELSLKVDHGDLSVLDELVDLIIYEQETESMAKYIDMAAAIGNDKACYVKGKSLEDWNIKKLFLYRELAKKKVLDAELYYEQVRNSFFSGYVVLAIIAALIIFALTSIWYVLNVQR